MQRFDLDLECVTPLFLAGADTGAPELRAPSVKGALHFWLRALEGRVCGDNLDALRCAEALHLGSTRGASPVALRLSLKEGHKAQRFMLPHRPDRRAPAMAWTEGSMLSFSVCARLGQKGIPDPAIAALALLLNLGGIGRRSRRGFGSLQASIRPAEYQNLAETIPIAPSLRQMWTNGNALVDHTRQLIDEVCDLYPDGGATAATSIPEYPILCENHAKVLVCSSSFPVHHGHEEAMKPFWDMLRGAPYRMSERAFGYATGGRRASPILLHLARTGAGYHYVITAFRSKPEPMGAPGWRLVDRFVQDCQRTWGGIELLGGGVTW